MGFIRLDNKEFSRESYNEAIDSLFAQVPTFQRAGAAAYKPGLEASANFDMALGRPSSSFRSIHVAGTNGKGSVSSMIAACLQSAGYRTGLYTSPHLVDFRERIKVDGKMVPEEFVFSFLKEWSDYIIGERISFFEITTALAFDWFSESGVDVAVVETGLGGRLDSTNIIRPELSVITNIGLDHCEFLGNTLPEIAFEKAGIIKAGIPAVVGESSPEYDEVFVRKAEQEGSCLYFASGPSSMDFGKISRYLGISSADELEMGLKGYCQKKNIDTVLGALSVLAGFADGKERFRISPESMRSGIRDVVSITGLRGRWERISDVPRAYCDTGHNAHGLKYVFEQLKGERYKRLYIVYGMVADKDLSAILPMMPRDAYYICTNAKGSRALPAGDLSRRLRDAGLNVVDAIPDAWQAYRRALSMSGPDDFVYVGGSTFVVAEVLENI